MSLSSRRIPTGTCSTPDRGKHGSASGTKLKQRRALAFSLFKGIFKSVGNIVGSLLGIEKPKIPDAPAVPTIDDADAAAQAEQDRLAARGGYSATLAGGLLSEEQRKAGAGTVRKTLLGSA